MIDARDDQQAYEIVAERGADFLTPLYDWGQEIRCFFRYPDGHPFEISQRKRGQPPTSCRLGSV